MGIQVERRRYPRLQVVYGAVATLGESKFGIITDISHGGLAFQYIALNHRDEFLRDSLAISIAYNVAGFIIRNIPCQIIRDFSRTSEPYPCPPPPTKKKCCVQFDPLTSDQKLQLQFFLKHFTAGSLPSRLPLNGYWYHT